MFQRGSCSRTSGGSASSQTLHDPPLPAAQGHLLPKRRLRGTCGRCPWRYQGSQVLMISICKTFWWVLLLQVSVRAIIQAVLWGRRPQQTLPQNSLINSVLLLDVLGFWFEEAFQSPGLLLFYSAILGPFCSVIDPRWFEIRSLTAQ